MPEFVLDTNGVVIGADLTGNRWSDLDSFTQGYVEAAFFTESSPATGVKWVAADDGFCACAVGTVNSAIKASESPAARIMVLRNVAPCVVMTFITCSPRPGSW